VGSVFLSNAGQRRYEFTKVGTLCEFSSKSNLKSNLVENWRSLWLTPQGIAMNGSETPFHLCKRYRYRLLILILVLNLNEFTVQMATTITRTKETNRNNQSTHLLQAGDTPNGNNNDSSQNNQQSVPTHPAALHPTLEDLILDQKVTLRAPLEARHPLLLCQGPPFCWDPVPYHPVVPLTYHQPTARRSCPMAVGLPHSCQHGCLAIWKPVVVELPGMHPQLLPI
jgi:hypothetical protein